MWKLGKTIAPWVAAAAVVGAGWCVCKSWFSKLYYVAPEAVPGTYEHQGWRSRDVITLRPDRSFLRVAEYGGRRHEQTGNWSYATAGDHTEIDFKDMEPNCIGTAPTNDTEQSAGAAAVLCSLGETGGWYCHMNGDRPVLCLGYPNEVRFAKQ